VADARHSLPTPAPEPGERPRDVGSPVGLLITLAAMAATILLVLTSGQTVNTVLDRPEDVAIFLGLTLVLQFFSFEVYGRGSLSVGAVGLLAGAFTLDVGSAVAIALIAAGAQAIRKQGRFHRAIFDAANLGLSAGAASAVYAVLAPGWSVGRLAVAALAGVAFSAINLGLLCLAMSLSEALSFRTVWHERFHWARYHYAAYGPLAVALTIAYEKMGVIGLMAFALPPAVLIFSVRQYLDRTRAAVEEVRQANEELRVANTRLEARNEDLNQLFQFAGGLSARAHDRNTLMSYAEEALARLTGTRAAIAVGPDAPGEIGLLSGGQRVGAISMDMINGFDGDRWERLRDAILPQLATAVESAELVDQVRKKHLATIAALSRSMEAKDYYTGGHTERVAEFSVALALHLGYSGPDLDAIEIGALLHDIGKIGVPERILHKSGPLDEEEWKVMKEHPIISDFILAEVDLHPFVRQIARSSHERMDGAGYPDGLVAEKIPLPARIVLVADAFDALTSDRPYRRARSVPEAMAEIREHAGTQFCPAVVGALEALYGSQPHMFAGRLAAVRVA
jgi:HD-GYP domain-containing protein (c-di-GMP phosphodiesterase class II)